MNYITVKEAAEQWRITPRQVQNNCRDGTIEGAVRIGRDWMIPEKAERSKGKNKCAEKLPRKSPYLLITDLYSRPGTVDRVLKAFSDKSDTYRLLCAYIADGRGEIDEAIRQANELLSDCKNADARISAQLLRMICAMYTGNIVSWRDARQHIAKSPCKNETERERIKFWLATADGMLFGNAGYPEEFLRGSFDFLPRDAYAAARFFYAKYLYVAIGDSLREAEESGKSKHYELQLFMLPPTCELLISQTAAEGVLVAELYLRLIAAVAYYNNGKEALAAEHIDRAIALALPDKIYAPLAEYCRPLDLLLYDRLEIADPAALAAVKTLNKRLMEGWTKLHNTVLDRHVSNDLTTREREVSRLAVLGLSNREIAERLYITLSAVKQAISNVMDKTGAGSRSEFIRFL
jgi:DNA-binding CsgD family transcriptional regulator